MALVLAEFKFNKLNKKILKIGSSRLTHAIQSATCTKDVLPARFY